MNFRSKEAEIRDIELQSRWKIEDEEQRIKAELARASRF
jgi:hypothetical protein